MSVTEKYLTNTTKTYQMIREYIIYMNLFAYNKVAFKKHYSTQKVMGLSRTEAYNAARYCFKWQWYKFPVLSLSSDAK